MIFRSHKKLPIGILKVGDDGFVGLYSSEHGEYKGNVLVIREITKENYLKFVREEGDISDPSILGGEDYYKFYYEIHID
jgi:hypothetical protein